VSIVVCCNLPDGIILGADSAVTVSGTVVDESTGARQSGVLKVFERGQKIFQLRKDLPLGLATFGIFGLGERTVGSHLEEFEVDRLANVLQNTGLRLDIRELCKELWAFFRERYDKAFREPLEAEKKLPFDQIPAEEKPGLGIVVAGYPGGSPLGEVWVVRLPFGVEAGGVQEVRKRGKFGAAWFGVSGPVTRFVKGFDPALPDELVRVLRDKIGAQADGLRPELERVLSSLEYRIPYPGMPLEEGIEHVRYLTGLAISFARYAPGPPVCGGDVRMAVITRKDNFRWIGQEPV
jgi:hypothetical protein